MKVALDPTAAVKSVIAMFTPNDLVNVPALGKPLPLTGTWGAQTRFPGGEPKRCVLAAMPCIKVIYTIPAAKITCEWLLGYFVAVEPQPDGVIQHAVHEVVLDENADAAHYTMRKAWSAGDVQPRPVVAKSPVYPTIAMGAHIGGVVSVRLVISPDGSVLSASPLDGPKLLQEAALTAVRQWKFAPPQIGSQPTSFRMVEYFTFNSGHPDFAREMDPSGKVVLQNGDPHYAPGFSSVGTSGEQWQSCTAVDCTQVSPPTPPH
jgi:TonB family protein